ncbi:hypothetical protein D3C86_1401760 [compost metagenome]
MGQGVLEHQLVEPGHPAEAGDPGQEYAGGDGLALGVEQAGQHLVVQDHRMVCAAHDGLEVELQLALADGVIQPGAPFVLIEVSASFIAV